MPCNNPRTDSNHAAHNGVLAVILMSICCGLLSGCAALTNPVANGVPVRILPDELLGESREGFEPIPLTLLRQKPPKQYILAAGDTLGVYIEGVLGDADTPPPVNIPDSADLPPSIGYPIPIRQDGTISLPYVDPIKVAGMTIEEAEDAVVKAYLKEQIVRPEARRILVTLMRPRYYRVLVIRDDSQQRQVQLQTESLLGLGTSRTTIGGGNQGIGLALELPAYENDVLNALTRSGGLPGLDSTQEVIVQRGYGGQTDGQFGMHRLPTEADLAKDADGRRRIIRIPMRIRPGDPISITPEDVILENGDIVMVRAREPQFYYTGGLMPADEIPLPNDYDLTVLEAVLKARGGVLNGGFNNSNLNGTVIQAGIGSPNPSLLAVIRKTPNCGQVVIRVDLNEAMRDPRENILVQPGDVLLLQETPQEATTRYISQQFQANFFFRWLNQTDAQGSGQVFGP